MTSIGVQIPQARTPKGLSLQRSFSLLYVRNKMQLFFSLIFPLLFLAMFAALGSLNMAPPTVDIVGPTEVETAGLSESGVGVVHSPDLETALEAMRAGTVLAVVDTTQSTLWLVEGSDEPAVTALAASNDLTVVEVPQSEIFSFVRFGLPGILTFATLNVAFFGTTSTLIELRKEGALNLLRRTPASPLKIVLAPLPSKFIGFCAVYAFIIAASLRLDFLPAKALPASIAVGLLSFAVAMTWAYLLGARGTQTEIASAATGMGLPVLLMAGGVLLPFEILPEAVRNAARFNPVAHIGSLYRWSVTGVDPTWPIWTSVIALLISAVIALGITVRLFRWR